MIQSNLNFKKSILSAWLGWGDGGNPKLGDQIERNHCDISSTRWWWPCLLWLLWGWMQVDRSENLSGRGTTEHLRSEAPEALGHHCHARFPTHLTWQSGILKAKNQVVSWSWSVVMHRWPVPTHGCRMNVVGEWLSARSSKETLPAHNQTCPHITAYIVNLEGCFLDVVIEDTRNNIQEAFHLVYE